MKIVIVGAGFTGVQLAKLLINEKNQVTLIDNDEDTIRHASNQLDCSLLCADGNNLETLEQVGISKADALVCVTESDEVNMITCSLVDAVYPDVLKIARVRNYAYYVNSTKAEQTMAGNFGVKHRPLYGINYMIHPDVEAADAIVKAIENGAVGNVLTFDESDLELARITVFKDSPIDGISLREIRSRINVPFLVAYVEKDGDASLPKGDTVICSDTTLGVLVSKKDIPEVLKLCGSVQKELKSVALIGAGRIGSIIAEKLIKPQKTTGLARFFVTSKTRKNIDCVIIDSDDERAKAASERFPDARVMCADASDEAFLNDEGIVNFDLAVCVTHNHELNMVLAAYLESLGVGQSISLVSSAEFAVIAQKLGVDVSIPLRDCVVDSIMSHLRGKAVKEIHTVTTGQLEIVECEITAGSKCTGKSLMETSLPGDCLVLLSKKGGEENYSIANGQTRLYSGDHIVLITEADSSKKILSFFTGRE